MEWIHGAARVNAVEVALWLCYKEGFVGAGNWVHVRPYELNKYGLTRKRKDRQINSLAKAGLIAVKRGVGRCHSIRAVRA